MGTHNIPVEIITNTQFVQSLLLLIKHIKCHLVFALRFVLFYICAVKQVVSSHWSRHNSEIYKSVKGFTTLLTTFYKIKAVLIHSALVDNRISRKLLKWKNCRYLVKNYNLLKIRRDYNLQMYLKKILCNLHGNVPLLHFLNKGLLTKTGWRVLN